MYATYNAHNELRHNGDVRELKQQLIQSTGGFIVEKSVRESLARLGRLTLELNAMP